RLHAPAHLVRQSLVTVQVFHAIGHRPQRLAHGGAQAQAVGILVAAGNRALPRLVGEVGQLRFVGAGATGFAFDVNLLRPGAVEQATITRVGAATVQAVSLRVLRLDGRAAVVAGRRLGEQAALAGYRTGGLDAGGRPVGFELEALRAFGDAGTSGGRPCLILASSAFTTDRRCSGVSATVSLLICNVPRQPPGLLGH